MVWWALQSVVFTVPLIVVPTVISLRVEAARPWLVPVIVLAVGLLLVGVVVEPLWRYAVHRWETTDEAVYAASGWIVREWRIAPISRIQTVDTIRGPLEQVLGLATLRITTASAKGAIDIGGLDAEVAAEAARHLTEIAEITPGDAT